MCAIKIHWPNEISVLFMKTKCAALLHYFLICVSIYHMLNGCVVLRPIEAKVNTITNTTTINTTNTNTTNKMVVASIY